MNTYSKVISIAIVTSLLFSCTSNINKHQENANQTKDTVVSTPKENFPKGQVIDKIVCKNNTSQSYALYLPSTYSNDKLYPVVYAFDAHGTGKLPVANYKDLAEKYGYIIAGSNNSKNGNAWEESEHIAAELFMDVQNRLSINTARVYLLGFSGGARVVNGIAIENGAIAGVICCGAAAPGTNSTHPRNNYTWLGIAGLEDFNYTEMRKYDMVDLAGHNVKHGLITFDGKHEWCPKQVMDEAFWWLELCEMRNNKSSINDTMVKRRITLDIKQIEKYMQSKQFFNAYNLCKKTINFYDGLYDLSYCFKTFKTLQTNDDVDKGLKDEDTLWAKEDKLKNYYVTGFQSNDFERWKKEIGSLNQKIKTEKNKNDVQSYKRVLGYLSLAAYMQCSGALKQNAIPAAEYFCKVYVLIDPTNSEAYYFTAIVNAKEGKANEAINALNGAVKNGFKDLPRLQNEIAFDAIRNSDDYRNVLKQINEQ